MEQEKHTTTPSHNVTEEGSLDFCPVAKNGSGHLVGYPSDKMNTFEYRRAIYCEGQGSKEHISGETE